MIKLILAFLLFGCLFNFPYGYYQFVRFVALVGFLYLAYDSFERDHKSEAFIYVALAILLQPFIKIALGRTMWNAVDVSIGIGLLLSLFPSKNKNNS